ncbi:PREDICTED: collagen alpha-1(III) chain [Tarenaya hassleriana]|uniref:collagen alpha-1(III) chain n=1 Tax=Tarenaya hassleriana TaxID=28532 RepID=UPI00053C4684|nr:PREDICTED: collagen alpha-1(III) chain [Tarenaya hassleriana]
MGKPNQNQSRNVQNHSITHFSHPHRLDLIPPSSPSPPCSACNLPGRSTYSCKPCNFALHESCAQMPRVMTHPSHPSHRLTLLAFPAYVAGCFNCDACGLTGTGFSYHCSKCEYDVHALCANNPLSVRDRSHPQHQLKLMFESPYGPKGFSCDVCGRIGKNQWLYRCPTCEFDAHVRCVATTQPHLQHVSSVPVSYGGGGNAHHLDQHNSFPGHNGGDVNSVRPIGGNIRPNGPPRKYRPNIQSGYPNGPGGQNRNLGLNSPVGPIGRDGKMGQSFGPVAVADAGGYDRVAYHEGGEGGDSYGGGDDEFGYDEGGVVDIEGEDATYSENNFGGGRGSDLGGGSDFGSVSGGGDDVYGGDDADDLYPADVDASQPANGPQEPNQNMVMSGPVLTGPGNIRYGPTERPRNMNRYRASGRPNDPRNTNRRTYGYGPQPKAMIRRQNNPNWPATIVNGPNYLGPDSSNGPDQMRQDPSQGGMVDEGDMYFGEEYTGGYNDENYDEGDDGGSVYSGSYCESDFSGYVDIGRGDGYDDMYDSMEGEMHLQAEDDYVQSTGGFGDPNQFTPMGPLVDPNPNRPRPNGSRNLNMNGRYGGVRPNALTRRTRYGPNAAAGPNGPNGANGPNGLGSAAMNAMVQGLCQGFAQNMIGNSDGGDSAVTSVASSVLGGLLGGNSES